MALLVYLFLYWSISNLILRIICLTQDPKSATFAIMATIIACNNSLTTLAVFGTNLVMAMERAFRVYQKPIEDTRKWYILIAVVVLMACCTMIAIFSTSLSSDGFTPDRGLQALLWFIVTLVVIGSMYIGIIVAYIATYVQSKKLIRKTLTNPQHEEVRERMERSIFKSCTIMVATTLICYTPIIVFLLVKKFIEGGSHLVVLKQVFNVLVTMDAIACPLLVIYFNHKIRDCLFM
ncbi:hypothetical protein BDR26DRAFT_872036 [Obelidium mucronatum]|nr:hypothetical protein BDR26DRAFT_872036 [Obelidium mucronatum]